MPKNQESERQENFFSIIDSSCTSSGELPKRDQSTHAKQVIVFTDSPQVFNYEVAGGLNLSRLDELPKDILETIFCGYHNLVVGWEVLKRINPSELMSAFFAVGNSKYGAHLSARNKWRLNPDNFLSEYSRNAVFEQELKKFGYPADGLDLVGTMKQMNKISYMHPKFSFFASRLPNILGRHQSQRLETVPEEDSKAFMESFYKPYVCSTKQDDLGSFPDPVMHGKDKHVYAKRIYDSVRAMYGNNSEARLAARSVRISQKSQRL